MQIVIDDSILDGPSSESESSGDESENNSEREREREPTVSPRKMTMNLTSRAHNGCINYILLVLNHVFSCCFTRFYDNLEEDSYVKEIYLKAVPFFFLIHFSSVPPV